MELVSECWLRSVNAKTLAEMKDPICVVSAGSRLAVVVPYSLYADIQFATSQSIEVLQSLENRIADTRAAAGSQ